MFLKTKNDQQTQDKKSSRQMLHTILTLHTRYIMSCIMYIIIRCPKGQITDQNWNEFWTYISIPKPENAILRMANYYWPEYASSMQVFSEKLQINLSISNPYHTITSRRRHWIIVTTRSNSRRRWIVPLSAHSVFSPTVHIPDFIKWASSNRNKFRAGNPC